MTVPAPIDYIQIQDLFDMAQNNATQSWKFAQIGIRVSDLAKSLSFYKTVLGLKEITRFRGDTVTAAFMGYPDGGPGTPETLFHREGVLELLHADGQDPEKLVTNSSREPGFGLVKLCFSVPNIEAALNRLKEYNATILKEPGDSKGADLVATGLGMSLDRNMNKVVWEAVDPVVFAADPDGYVIELVPQ